MLSISSYFIEFEILPTDGYSSTIRKTLYPKISEQLKGKRPETSVFCHQSQTADDTPDRGVSLRMTVTATALRATWSPSLPRPVSRGLGRGHKARVAGPDYDRLRSPRGTG